jgi:hypothetical protein
MPIYLLPQVYITSSSMDSPDSLFGSKKSAWDRIFDPIRAGETPILPSVALHPARLPSRHTPFGASGEPKVRRQAMTAKEQSTFDEMFNLIFTAATESGKGKTGLGEPSDSKLTDLLGIGRNAPVAGKSSQGIVGLYDRLRGQSKRAAWTSEADEELDRKKEEMELCDTDQQLLEWAMQEVFGESKKFEAAAREAIAKSSADTSAADMPPLQPPTYPHLLAELMKTFRDKYRDPHLALSMFDHARHLSIPSYVFGCTTPAYNELIQTRWACFRDLRGVMEALEEMRVNGIQPDSRTRTIVEGLRREVGERNMWEEHGQENEKGALVLGRNDAVWDMLGRIEQLSVSAVSKSQKRRETRGRGSTKGRSAEGVKMKRWEGKQEWKQQVLRGRMEDDEYEFGKWEERDEERLRATA